MLAVRIHIIDVGDLVSVIVRVSYDNTRRSAQELDVAVAVADIEGDHSSVGLYRPFERTEFINTLEYLLYFGDHIVLSEAFLKRAS